MYVCVCVCACVCVFVHVYVCVSVGVGVWVWVWVCVWGGTITNLSVCIFTPGHHKPIFTIRGAHSASQVPVSRKRCRNSQRVTIQPSQEGNVTAVKFVGEYYVASAGTNDGFVYSFPVKASKCPQFKPCCFYHFQLC